MEVRTLDYGAYTAELRQFGPPEVIDLDGFAGNATGAELVELFHELVEALTFRLHNAAGGAARRPQVSFFAGEAVPFAVVASPFTIAATLTSVVTFAVGVQQAGANDAPAIVVPLPPLELLPKWSAVVSVVNGAAGDAIDHVRVYRRRLELVEVPAVRDDTQ